MALGWLVVGIRLKMVHKSYKNRQTCIAHEARDHIVLQVIKYDVNHIGLSL